MAKDPVCGMDVNPDQAAASYEYNGENYYFCAEGCKNKFAENPEDYL
jgi:YHS domain-containing protein